MGEPRLKRDLVSQILLRPCQLSPRFKTREPTLAPSKASAYFEQRTAFRGSAFINS
jgi:hypothetical protein